MTLFWVLAALMTGATIIYVIRPLMKPDEVTPAREAFDVAVFKDQLLEVDHDRENGLLTEEEAEAAKVEIQRRMLGAADLAGISGDITNKSVKGRKAAAVLVLGGLPAMGLGLYLYLGNPGLPNQPFAERNIPQPTQAASGASHEAVGGSTEAMIGQLAERLLMDPADVEGWMLLGRSYISVGRYDDALNAFRRARGVANGRLEVDIAYAEALSIANEMTVTDEALQIFQAVRAQVPFEPKSRYYIGMQMAQSGDVKGALQEWIDLASLSPNDAPWMGIVNQQITRAAAELEIDPKSIQPTAEAVALKDQMQVATNEATADASNNATGELKLGDARTGAPSQPTETASAPRGPTQEDVEAASQMSAGDREAMIRAMVQQLADRMADEPDNLEGWQRLERAYRVLGETAKADKAAEHIKSIQN